MGFSFYLCKNASFIGSAGDDADPDLMTDAALTPPERDFLLRNKLIRSSVLEIKIYEAKLLIILWQPIVLTNFFSNIV